MGLFEVSTSGNLPQVERSHRVRVKLPTDSPQYSDFCSDRAVYQMPSDEAEDAELVEEQERRRKQRRDERRAWRATHVWHPHQLRHNAGTRIREDYDAETAQVILGHRHLKTTEIYAAKNLRKARQVMAEVG